MVDRIREIRIPAFVADILDQFEAKSTSFPDWEVSGALSDAIRNHNEIPQAERNGWWAELAAFKFSPSRPRETSCWGIYFGPVTTITDKAGKEHHSPSLEELGPEIVSHWRCRAKKAKHPILRARYSDLVWDLTKICSNQHPEIEYSRMAIDSYVAASELEPGEFLLDQIGRLTRALELALGTGDNIRVEAIRDAMFRFYENRILSRADQGPWCFLFDAVYGNKHIPLKPEQLQSMISWLESFLSRCTNPADPGNLSPWTAKEIALRLARFYDAQGKTDNVKQVVTAYGDAFVHVAKQADGIIAVPWLQGVYEDYISFGFKNEAEDLLLLSKAKGSEISNQMATIKGSITVTKDELQKIVDAVVGDDPDQSLDRIASNFIPRIADAKETLRHLAEEHPLLAHIGVSVVGEEQIIAKAGSVH